tara:strand:+ start:1648 stop:2280 length:633 start_codon:yes stop_codon:yes gene_type:complete
MFFSIVPNISYDQKPISYPFSESDFVVAKNFFRRYKMNDEIFSQAVYFQQYTIRDGERPDTIAERLYGDPFLDWVVILVNNMVNAQYDWPRSNYEVYRIAESEYDDPYSEIHHYEIKESIGPYQTGQHVDEIFYNGQHKLNISGSIVTKNGNEIASPVTAAEWLQSENEKKRQIYLLKPVYTQGFIDDFRRQNKYKKGTNYISQRLKRTG